MHDTVERKTHIVSACYFQPARIFKIDVTTSDYVSYDANVGMHLNALRTFELRVKLLHLAHLPGVLKLYSCHHQC